MKQIINFAATLLVLTLLTTSIFAQEEIRVQNQKMVKEQTLQGTNNTGPNWVDENGDGICDNVGTSKQGQGNGQGKGYGLKDGSGSHVRPQDGTGYGKAAGAGNGTGDCDGTGSKGSSKRKGGK
jgi:hypothetical protein